MPLLTLDLVGDGLRTLWASICSLLYKLIAFLYQVFINLSSVRLLTEDSIKPIYQRVTMIIAIVMVFYVTFEVVKYVIEPDTMTDKEKGAGNIVKRMIITVVLIAFVPMIFEGAYKLQNALIQRQVIPTLILGRNNVNMQKMGNEFSAQLFGTFYYYDSDFWKEHGKNDLQCAGTNCSLIVDMNLSNLAEDGDLSLIQIGINDYTKVEVQDGTSKEKIKNIHFDGLLAVIVGGFAAYVMLLYCIDVGTRVAQLVYLQIIAPIPIIGYLSPKKDGIFQKWVKQCITTYLDLFIRVSVICFALLIVEILGEAYQNHTLLIGISNASRTIEAFMYIFIVMGILMFTQRFPKLLGELFPKMGAASGSLGLKAGERVAPLAARAIGAGIGGVRTGVRGLARRAAWTRARNKANGWATGFSALTKEGRKNNKNKRQQAKENRQELRTANRHSRDVNKKDEFDAAKEAWQKKSKSETAVLRQQIKDANARGDSVEAKRLGQELAAKNKELQNSAEFQRWDRARKNVQNTSISRTSLQATNNLKTASERLKAADKELNEATASGDIDRINAAKKARDAAQQSLNKAQESKDNARDELNNFIFGNSEELKEKYQQDLDSAQEKVITDQNQHHQGLGGVVAGTAGAALSGAWTGGHAAKVGDIVKNVQQADKKDTQRVKAVQQYYDNGGTGFVDRTVQQAEKNLGAPTAYERTVLESRAYEPQIKTLEAQSSLTKDVKATADSAEDRLKDKIGDLKLKPAEDAKIKTGLKDAQGNDEYAEIKTGETLADVYRKYEGRATKAQSEADEAAKRLNEARQSGQPTEALERYAEEKATAASRAKYAVTQVQKNAARHEYTEILKDFAKVPNTKEDRTKAMQAMKNADIYDNVAVEKVYDALSSLEVARTNPTVAADVIKNIRASAKNETEANILINEFMTGQITSFSNLDAIKTAHITAGNVYERDKKAVAEKRRSIETSAQTYAQKAANDFNPNGGK